MTRFTFLFFIIVALFSSCGTTDKPVNEFQEFDGQVIFPEFDLEKWKEVSRIHHSSDDRHLYSFDFVVYEHT